MTGLLEHEDDFIRELAKAILKIARISQDKRRRWRKILAEDPEFFQLCDELDLVPDYFRESEEYVMRDPLPGEEMLPDHAFFPEDSDDDFPVSEFFVDEDRYWELTPFQKRWKGDQFEDVGGWPF